MIQAVETTEAVDGGKVWFIDVIGDKTEIDKGHLLSSVLWDMVPVYDAMVQDLMAGTFGTRGYQIGLENDSVRLLQSSHIPSDIWSELMDLRDKIISGEVSVANISDAQEVRALMTSVDINDG
jgi:simple sugar transport system substrate-binding protein